MGMASVNQTRPHCVNQLGKTHYKHLAAWHGRGMSAWRAMCVSAFSLFRLVAAVVFSCHRLYLCPGNNILQ